MALVSINLAERLVFSRPTPADYEDEQGATQTAPIDVPRIDWTSGANPGLLLDDSLDERALISEIPNHDSSEGTWMLDADLTDAIVFPGMGLNYLFTGSGVLIFTYKGGVAKCFYNGELAFSADNFFGDKPDGILVGGTGKIYNVLYSSEALSAISAKQKATGTFAHYHPIMEFNSGAPGVLHEIFDRRCLFQDSTGQIPVTEDGQAVGLMLDKRFRFKRGEELNQNFDFSAGSDNWSQTSENLSWKFSSGSASMQGTVDGACDLWDTSIVPVEGRFYEMKVVISEGNNETVYFKADSDERYVSFSGSIGEHTLILRSDGGHPPVFRGSSNWDGAITEFSVKEVPGFHGMNRTTSKKPTYRTDGLRHWLEWPNVNTDGLWFGPTGYGDAEMSVAIVTVNRASSWTAWRTRATANGGYIGLIHPNNTGPAFSPRAAYVYINGAEQPGNISRQGLHALSTSLYFGVCSATPGGDTATHLMRTLGYSLNYTGDGDQWFYMDRDGAGGFDDRLSLQKWMSALSGVPVEPETP